MTQAMARPAAVPVVTATATAPGLTLPLTTENLLERIRELGKRIGGHIEFMCAVGSLCGTSAEAKDKAVALFHECLLTLEQRLGRIQDDLRLQ